MAYLCHIHVGPVQSFIAAGRRTQDLYLGSWLLSELARAGVLAAASAGSELLYPVADQKGQLPQSVPNLFMFVTEEEPHKICAFVEEAILDRWHEIAGTVRDWLARQIGGGAWQAQFDNQVSNWLELYWVAVPYEAGQHSAGFAAVKRAMASRKNARYFPQVDEAGWKCTVTGAVSALNLNWESLQERVGEIRLRKNEALGALALIKRFAQDARVTDERLSFPSTEDIAGAQKTGEQSGKELAGYYAILLMDGDQMGIKLSQLKTPASHRNFSAALAGFADKQVPAIIDDYDQQIQQSRQKNRQGRAALVYAGGDDVLALLPVHAVLACADEIRKQYTTTMDVAGIRDATMSAGIAIVPSNYPLDIAMDLARTAEKTAKNDFGRNAVVIIEAHGGGQQRISGAQWLTEDVEVINTMQNLMDAFTEGILSARIGYDIQDMSYRMGGSVPAAARAAELTRLFKRRTMSFSERPKDWSVPDELFGYELATLGESKYCGWESLANWVILTRFLATGGRES